MIISSDMHDMLMSASTSYRLAHSDVKIDGNLPIDFRRYPYIPEIIDEDRWERISILKGAQMGFTIACIMKALEYAKKKNLRGIGYFFPSEGEVSDFAKARFSPMMTNNPLVWGNFVQDTDSAALKRIGDTFLYFRGAGQKGAGSSQKSQSKQKSIPLDILILDERDEMEETRVDAIEHRLDGTENPRIINLSTPTLPGYGIDLEYSKSDQRVWMWKCGRCGDWTCLELSYPDCIVEFSGARDPYYQCDKCHGELERAQGEWVARVPGVKDHAGFYISQLSSPTKQPKDIIKSLSNALEKGRRKEFENQVLARGYAEVDEEITLEMLLALVDPKLKRNLRHEGPCAMGVDPGKPNWYEVRARVSDVDSEVVAMGRADSYEELGRIADAYNVGCGVIDQGYDPSAVAKFVQDHKGWYGCLYVGGKKSSPDWDYKEKLIKTGRTRILDDAQNAIVKKRVKYFERTEFFDKHFAPQMMNLKRASIDKNVRTGEAEAIWVVTGGMKNDHLRHADAYCNLALERVGLTKSRARMRNSESTRDRNSGQSPSPWAQ